MGGIIGEIEFRSLSRVVGQEIGLRNGEYCAFCNFKTTIIEEMSKIFAHPLYTISEIVYNMCQLINLAWCWESIKGNGKER